MFGVLKAWRRGRVLRNNRLDDVLWQQVAWRFGFVLRLDENEQVRLRDLSVLFLHEKQLSSTGDFELTDEMKLGIAIARPTSVVNRAVEIPPASSVGLGVAPPNAITWNDSIIPCTVPNSPIIGLIFPINAM